ncbi:MAG: multidrug ABC transporter substrate-binding protein, partial [Acidobacteria bacterium 13_1_40CM_4_61_5]
MTKTGNEGPRRMSVTGWLDTVLRDLKYTFRMLARTPGFTAVAVLTLALGIGANTAIFTLLDQVLLRLLPVKDPQQLILLTMRGRHYGSNWGGNAISHPMFRDFRDHNEVFSDMFCRFPYSASLTFGGQAELVQLEMVSGTYFSVLGVRPFLGRLFTPDDDSVPSGHPYIVLNYDFWRTRFASDPGIVGKDLLLNNYKMTVVGVAQPGFDGVELGRSPKLFVPIMMQSRVIVGNPEDMLKERRTRWVNAFGRLKPGISQQQAKAALQPFMHSMLEQEVQQAAFSHASAHDRNEFLKCWIDVLPGSQGRSYLRRQLSTPLWVLMAITGAVLLIACANLANLMLVRGSSRVKEIAVRLAMGATRPRIIGQLLIESLSLSALGGLTGLAVAFWADRALMKIYLPSDSGGMNISSAPDLRILLFNLAVTVLTGVVFGLVPALQTTKPNIAGTLKDQAGAVVGGSGHNRLRKALVIAQVTLSLLLLVGAGLFVRSLANLRNLGPGFPVEHLVGFEIDPSLNGYTPDRMKIFYPQLIESLRSIPGTQSAGLASQRILEDNEWDSGMSVEGFTPDKPDDHAQPYMNQISPNYFATLGVPIVAGRDFTPNDNREIKHSPDAFGW